MSLIAPLLLFLGVVLQTQVMPVLLPDVVQQSHLRPDLLLLLVVAITLVDDVRTGAIWGFAGGLLLDLFSPTPLGANALALVLVALLASLGTASPFRSNFIMPLAMVAICTLFYYLITMVMLAIFGQHPAWLSSIIHLVLPALIVNVILMPVFYTFLYWLSSRTRPTLPEEWQ